MPETEPAYAYGAIRHPRWCDREACAIFRTEVCHRSVAQVIDSNGGRVSIWLEAWDDFLLAPGATWEPALVLEVGGRGCGSWLAPAEAVDLITAVAAQVTRATGAPKGWRRLRARRFRDQTDRLLSRLPRGGVVPA